MEYPIKPNLLKDKTECLLNLDFKLNFATNTEMREMIKRHYYLEQIVFPDVDTQAYMMQTKANELSDLYNKYYELIGYAEVFENPLENYDRQEEWWDDGTAKSNNKYDSKYAEFPMDSTASKDVNKSDSNNNTSNESNTHHKGRVHGNIGVMTLSTAEKETEEMYARLYELKERYVREFNNYFMITL